MAKPTKSGTKISLRVPPALEARYEAEREGDESLAEWLLKEAALAQELREDLAGLKARRFVAAPVASAASDPAPPRGSEAAVSGGDSASRPPAPREGEPEAEFALRMDAWLKARRAQAGIREAAWTRGGPTVSELRRVARERRPEDF